MKKYIRIIITCIGLLILFSSLVKAEDDRPGYSEWSPISTGDEYEESAIQYGRRLPLVWSDWSTTKSDSLFQRYREGLKRYYIANQQDGVYMWGDANAKRVYRWRFQNPTHITYLYADVDTFIWETYSEYEGPPLQLYCNGQMIASVGKHGVYDNWNPTVDVTCKYMDLYMSDNNDRGRNGTVVVGTWLGSPIDEYSYVVTWNDGQDWRFDKQYEIAYGDNPQIPTSRTVYSHPIKYSITYDLDGGTANGELTYKYTVLDDVFIPTLSKLGYDFLGFYDDNGNKIDVISKGTYGNINLKAKFKRRLPTLYVGYAYFEEDKEKEKIDIKEVISQSKAKAIDEIEGDISDQIIIESIEYENKNKTVDNPEYLEIDKEDTVNITFSITNSVGGKAEVKRKFYILGKGKEIENYSDDIKIFSRYISEEYYETLDDKSIWRTNEYKTILYGIFIKE